MKILAVDTSSDFLVVGACDGVRSWEYRLRTGRLLSSLASAHLELILQALRWKAQDIDLFCCGLGPGSFTGVRIGMATVKAMAWACSRPVAGISSLEIISRNVQEASCLVVPAVDAKRGLIYCAAFRRTAGGSGATVKHLPFLSDRLLTAGEFSSTIKRTARTFKGPLYITGDALAVSAAGFTAGLGSNVVCLDKDSWYPSSRALIEASRQRAASKRFSDAQRIRPLYLYPQECQIRNARDHADR